MTRIMWVIFLYLSLLIKGFFVLNFLMRYFVLNPVVPSVQVVFLIGHQFR